jgi:acetyl-CoA carboxylase biotin carboxyl carrier protein
MTTREEPTLAAIRVNSDMAGSIWKLLVAVGDEVSEGTDLLLLESMKMEIPVAAPKAGKIAEIRVEEGETVAEGQCLLVLAG